MDKVSVIVPIYNSEKYLIRCLTSLVNQTYKNIEVILINDGSFDGSEKICKKFIKKYSNFRYYYKDNGGVSSARNLGIKKSLGKYICFVDSDDYVKDSYIYNLVSKIKCYDLIITNVNNKLNKELLELSDLDTLYYLFNNKYGYLGFIAGKIFNADIIKNNNLYFDEALFYNEDRLFVFKYLLYCKKILFYNKSDYYYYINDDSAMNKTHYNKKMLTEFMAYDKMMKLCIVNNLPKKLLINIKVQMYSRLYFLGRKYHVKELSNKISFKQIIITVFSFNCSLVNKLRLLKYYFFKY